MDKAKLADKLTYAAIVLIIIIILDQCGLDPEYALLLWLVSVFLYG